MTPYLPRSGTQIIDSRFKDIMLSEMFNSAEAQRGVMTGVCTTDFAGLQVQRRIGQCAKHSAFAAFVESFVHTLDHL